VLTNNSTVFTARRYAVAVYAGAVSVCLSVCLSVTSWYCVKTTKHRIMQTTPKIATKFDQCQLLQGRQMQLGWVKIGDFRQITGYISKTAKDTHSVSVKVE